MSRSRTSAAEPPAERAALDRAFAAKWEQFARLKRTEDTFERELRGLRRWLMMPFIAFVIPIEDPAVRDQLAAWQSAFADMMPYLPQPVERAHVTLHYVGQLRTSAWMLLPHTWERSALGWMAARAGAALKQCRQFTIGIGPLNAFANVLFAEVHDGERECLRATRLRVRRALPLRARPSSPWSYLPHVTLGFWGEQPAAPLVERLRPFRNAAPLPLRVSRVKLTVYWRDRVPLTPDILLRAREEVIAEFPLAPRE
ncbi:MAG TPA: 2'-5' RNA ligase family protein [Aggregatilineaceae bacterium]|nr:2'-5' RNA ligase family protein [Aggregatilineaceae bacterium]